MKFERSTGGTFEIWEELGRKVRNLGGDREERPTFGRSLAKFGRRSGGTSNIREELSKIREELSKIWEEHGRNV